MIRSLVPTTVSRSAGAEVACSSGLRTRGSTPLRFGRADNLGAVQELASIISERHNKRKSNSMPELLKPDLYAQEGTTSAPGYPSLKGARCAHCGFVFFPRQAYGCEVCGQAGDRLHPIALSGSGTLIASAEVHMHSNGATSGRTDVKALVAPFTIGMIKLDDGPTIRTILVEVNERNLKPGHRMVSHFIEVGSGPRRVLDIRFAPAS
ncbi:Zn-ribbon domain-containing OB-fold protein [Bradyrhizobium brasilense]|uniref:Zn-ribbon domain-containing OB-fold protein n=1 Tax=Bradyrhizobium brasilense TaxID=1419277 RepID=UPI003CC5450D